MKKRKVFYKIPKSTFDDIQLEAGVLLKTFDPENPAAPADEDIITATTGGIAISCVPQYTDMGADVDNCPNNMKELKKLDYWECTMSFTAIGTSAELIRMALGAADEENGKVTPRADIDQSDFEDSLWWVGEKASGGLVAVEILNALSTGGFSMKTTKNGKGEMDVTLTGHVSIEEQDVVPMNFYSLDASEGE